MLRWGASIGTFVFLKDSPAIQIILNIKLSIIFTILTAFVKPYESGTSKYSLNENSFKIFNEILVTYYLIFMLLLTDITSDQDLRKIVGFSELGIIGICVISNIIKAVLARINELLRRNKLKQAQQLLNQSKAPTTTIPAGTAQTKELIQLKTKSNKEKLAKHSTYSTNNDLSLTDITSSPCYALDDDNQIEENKHADNARELMKKEEIERFRRNEVYLPFHGEPKPEQFTYSRAIADEVLRRASQLRVQQHLLTDPTLGRESDYKSTLPPIEEQYYEQGM
ncbi:hypothetical protein FGO68_gene16469 [Halteria grandinella]|uniref:Uncharacterized protein n=1 Tax=Halteria grandinella TaxID=5974 RepID=A0A8J8P846_HALGN|nr:hypothetical protein FGO68_gene16469 [Halteria grandinella]